MTTRASQIECLLTPLHDYRDNSIASGYTAYFYSAGTSTAKNVWTEKEKTNPYTSATLGSNGTAQLYGDGVYKIIVKDTDGTTVYEWDYVKVQSPNVTVLSKADTYTATPDDDYIVVTTTGGDVTINLYAAALFTHPLCVKNVGTNNITIDPSGAELIEGDSTYPVDVDDMAVWLFSNGSTWYVANDSASNATDAINLVATIGGDKKVTAKAATVDIETNNEYLRQLNAAGDGYVNLIKANASDQTEVASNALLKGTPLLESGATINTNNAYLKSKDNAGTGTVNLVKANASDRLEFGAVLTTKQWNDGTNTIDFPTNGMAAAKFMLGNSNTIAWFYLNVAPPGWKVLATGADTVLSVSGGSDAYNANGGTAGGTWTQPNHLHTGPSHTHGATGLSGPSHVHKWLENNGVNTADQTYDANGSEITIPQGTSKGGAYVHLAISLDTGDTPLDDSWVSAAGTGAVTGSTAADGTGNTGNSATAATWRPSASIGKLFQLDTA